MQPARLGSISRYVRSASACLYDAVLFVGCLVSAGSDRASKWVLILEPALKVAFKDWVYGIDAGDSCYYRSMLITARHWPIEAS